MSLVLAVSFLSFTQISNDLAQSILTQGDTDLISRLIKNGYDIAPGDTFISTSPKQRWIVFLSLLVCVVGIVNAQLMSVSERFREIGTMKCLGALDNVVVRIFIIEAATQGLVGSIAGALLGAVASLFMGIINYTLLSIVSISWGEIGYSVLIAVITGTTLSLLGALYPAVIAAKMQPVEAMRVEQ
jgi:ABC-type antimicrobial peptide transport system permease subunit